MPDAAGGPERYPSGRILKMILLPGCKINLSLHVGGRNIHGYHELASIFLPLKEPSDRIHVETCETPGLDFSCDAPLDGENIIVRAYKAFFEATGYDGGIKARLRKHVPVGAGLGGGSADAGAFLTWMNGLPSKKLSAKGLEDIALNLGSDVPFFLNARPALVTGLGEEIVDYTLKWQKIYVVLVWPEIFISTKWAFERLDELRTADYDNTEQNLTNRCLNNRKLSLLEEADPFVFRNDLEWPAFERFPSLADLKENLYVLGAFYAAMSGSGSSVYGLFGDISSAEHAKSCLHKRNKYVYMTAVQSTGMWPSG